MLADPMFLTVLSGAMSTTQAGDSSLLRVVDLSPGKTVRVAANSLELGGRTTLTINHSESGENKGQITDRAAIRLDVRKDTPENGSVVAQATLTVSSPRVGFSATEVREIVRYLVGMLFTNCDTGGVDMNNLTRILQGEP